MAGRRSDASSVSSGAALLTVRRTAFCFDVNCMSVFPCDVSFRQRINAFHRLPLPDKAKRDAFVVLCKILSNIIEHPAEEKYRSINRDSQSYVKKVLLEGHEYGSVVESILFECGFVRSKALKDVATVCSQEDTLQLSPAVSLKALKYYHTVLSRELAVSENTNVTPLDLTSSEASKHKSTEDLRQQQLRELRHLREEQARKYREHTGGGTDMVQDDDPNERDSLCGNSSSNRHKPRRHQPSRGRPGLFSSFFGRSEAPDPPPRPSGPRVMTLRDLPQPPDRPRCCR